MRIYVRVYMCALSMLLSVRPKVDEFSSFCFDGDIASREVSIFSFFVSAYVLCFSGM